MYFERLNEQNVEQYIDYLKLAMQQEPDMMTVEEIDEEGIRTRLRDSFYEKSTSILAMENNQVVGRIEYHFYGCIQGGYRMAYVNWVYVLPEYRHSGVARRLFAEFEKDCKKHDIHQYYLIRATNGMPTDFTKNSKMCSWTRSRCFGKY